MGKVGPEGRSGPEGGGPEVEVLEGFCLKGGGPNPEKVEGCGARRVGGPRRVGSHKFRAFFPFSRHNFHSFFSLLGVLSLNFGGVIEFRDPEMCTVGLSGSKCAHFRVRNSKTPPKFNEKDPSSPRERRKNENCGGRGKKRAKFWAVRRRGGPAEGGGVREHTNLGPTHTADTHSRHTQQTHTADTHTADTHTQQTQQTHTHSRHSRQQTHTHTHTADTDTRS